MVCFGGDSHVVSDMVCFGGDSHVVSDMVSFLVVGECPSVLLYSVAMSYVDYGDDGEVVFTRMLSVVMMGKWSDDRAS